MKDIDVGHKIYSWCEDLFPICRSITGVGLRQSLAYLQEHVPQLKICSVPSGYKAFDWVVPQEWMINEAYIEDADGEKVVDFAQNNLHVVNYSTAVDEILELSELDKHLYSLPQQPNAIPYVTSYYVKRWGFCLTQNQRELLEKGRYRAYIDAKHFDGQLNYGEVIIPGKSKEEVFISTYLCHPSMANNELSGPTVTAAICQWLSKQADLKYTYRIVFVPETIGSIVYLSQNIEHLKRHVIAGFNVTCIGDNNAYSYLPSRKGDCYSDKIVQHILGHLDPEFKTYTWLQRGSDERQYCAPGVDLPMASIMRTKYGEYDEYHTSLDDLDYISPDGLAGGFEAVKQSISILEQNAFPKINVLCEPQLGKRGLYPNASVKGSARSVRNMMNLISYCDGETSTLDICNIIGISFWEAQSYLTKLVDAELVAYNNK